MKRITVLLLLLLTSQINFAQSKSVLETINKIEFEADTVESVFFWVADNIKYDVKKMNAVENGSISKKHSKFKSEEEYKAYLLEKVIKQKKGVCEDYSLLFDALVKELGYESHIVQGYTKDADGKVSRKVGHVWNAVKVNQKWKFYDATWGAGFVEKKFVKNYNKEWCDTDPKEMIKTHMPFDPMWQLLSNPVSYKAFEKNTETEKRDEEYNFNKLIAQNQKKEMNLQMKDKVSRSLEMGNGIRLIDKWRRRTTKQVGLYGITSQQDLLEETFESSKRAVDLYNLYIKAKNKQFKGKKWTIEKGEQNLLESKEEVEVVIATYKEIEVEDRKATNVINKNIRMSEKLLRQINKELEFINKVKSK